MVTEQQLKSWSENRPITVASQTYASIQRALETRLNEYTVDIFLQGSYGNATNIRASSDVDVVVQWMGAKLYGYELPPRLITPDDYWRFRAATVRALELAFPGGVTDRDKAIRVKGSDSRMDADVVPAPTFVLRRREEGIALFPRYSSSRVNFPKQHRDNGQDKNQRTGTYGYKPVVRVLKNLVRAGIDKGLVAKGAVPGYLIEGLVYNVPDKTFWGATSWMSAVTDVLMELAGANFIGFRAVDGVHLLFVNDPGSWRVDNACEAVRIMHYLVRAL